MKMLDNKVQILLDEPETEKGGIIFAQISERPNVWGLVESAGPKCVYLEEGDRVYVSLTTGTRLVKGDGKSIIVIEETRVMMKEED